jgi:hypothetical protein
MTWLAVCGWRLWCGAQSQKTQWHHRDRSMARPQLWTEPWPSFGHWEEPSIRSALTGLIWAIQCFRVPGWHRPESKQSDLLIGFHPLSVAVSLRLIGLILCTEAGCPWFGHLTCLTGLILCSRGITSYPT